MTNWSELRVASFRVDLPSPGAGKTRLICALRAALKSSGGDGRRRRQRKPHAAVPGGLLTPREAAARLACSIKTLNAPSRRVEIRDHRPRREASAPVLRS